MELHIFDQNINELGIADEFGSLIWTMRFYGTGVFELKAPATKNNVELLQKNRYIYREDSGEAGIIKSICEEISGESKVLNISGSMMKGLLDKRVTDASLFGGDPVSLYSLLMRSLCDPENFQYIPDLMMSGADALLNRITIATREYSNLGDSVRAAVYGSGYSPDIRLEPEHKRLFLYCREAADRSTDQMENPHIIFSDEFGNISDTVYSYSEECCCNYVRVRAPVDPEIAGYRGTHYYREELVSDESGKMKKFLIYDLFPESGGENKPLGAALSVGIVECEPVVVEETHISEDGSTVTMKYIQLDKTYAGMEAEARKVYSEYTENFCGVADGSGYRSEWQLGDYVNIEDSSRGMLYKKQIEEVTEVFEDDSVSVSVTFGDNLKTIIDLARGSA